MILANPPIRYAARLVLKISHGYDVVTPDDKLVRIAERSLAQIGHTFELGRFMVEFFPIRKCFFVTQGSTSDPLLTVLISQVCSRLVSWHRLEANCIRVQGFDRRDGVRPP